MLSAECVAAPPRTSVAPPPAAETPATSDQGFFRDKGLDPIKLLLERRLGLQSTFARSIDDAEKPDSNSPFPSTPSPSLGSVPLAAPMPENNGNVGEGPVTDVAQNPLASQGSIPGNVGSEPPAKAMPAAQAPPPAESGGGSGGVSSECNPESISIQQVSRKGRPGYYDPPSRSPLGFVVNDTYDVHVDMALALRRFVQRVDRLMPVALWTPNGIRYPSNNLELYYVRNKDQVGGQVWYLVANVKGKPLGWVLPDSFVPPAETITYLTSLIEANRWDPRLYFLRAEVESGNTVSDFPTAIQDYSEALRLNPGLADAYAGRATAYAWQDPEARATFRLLDPLSAKIAADVDSSLVTRALGDLFEAIRINPNHAQHYRDRARVAYFLKQYSRTVEDTTKSLQLEPGYVEAIHDRGLAYLQLGKYENALRDFDVVLKTQPESVLDIWGRAESLRGLEKYSAAIDEYLRAFSYRCAYQWNARLYYGLAKAQSMVGQNEQAAENFKHAIGVEPKWKSAFRELGNVEMVLKHYQEAIDAYKSLIKLEESVRNHSKLAEAYYEFAQCDPCAPEATPLLQSAVENYTNALELEPEDTETLLKRGEVFFALQEYDLALADFKEAQRLDPKNQMAKLWIAKIPKIVDPVVPPKEPSPVKKATDAVTEQVAYMEALTKLEQARAAVEQAKVSTRLSKVTGIPIAKPEPSETAKATASIQEQAAYQEALVRLEQAKANLEQAKRSATPPAKPDPAAKKP